MGITGSTEQEQEFKVGGRFLINGKYSFDNPGLQEVFVEEITEKAYKLRKACTDGTWYIEWCMKVDFHKNYNIEEYLDTLSIPPALPTEVVKIDVTPMTICPFCCGSGTIPDDQSTAGTKTCQYCLGSGYR